ncbi:MAG: SusD/RagB family nutrient-binding outer membrane lipoprotein, partial [Bacteroidales bacterium]
LTAVGLGFGNLAGVMQHTQKDGWSGGHNSYDWTSQDWGGNYGILRNAEELLNKSKKKDLKFHQGAALVLKAYNFGLIADLWGDAPYSKALLGELGGENLKPVFDSQQAIYTGILASLDTANILLSKNQSEYSNVNTTQDLLYQGNVAKWRKFANSLALRYYLRISTKDPATAKTGIEKITNNPTQYPLILDAADDAAFVFIGNSPSDSWPSTTAFDISETNWRRLKMCSTLLEKLQALKDPRIAVWANKIAIPLVIDPTKPDNYDAIVGGKRIISKKIADTYLATFGIPLNLDPEYVGLPPSWSLVPQAYNLNPTLVQAPINPHASHINDLYKKATDPLLKARILSAAEIHFDLAEIALKGWSAGGTAIDHYKAGIKASMDAWNLSSSYATYITNPGVVYAGTLDQIIEQKWIASWTAASESWFDWRRTGLPNLKPGTVVKRPALPLRFYYGQNEMLLNPDNSTAAINLLQTTTFTAPDDKNSAWSKTWVLQGTDKPW